jgi:hypothetical protein
MWRYGVSIRYPLRNIPREVDKALRHKARQEGRSLNEVAVEALSRGAGFDAPRSENHNLDFAIASWVEDVEFDKAVEDQRKDAWDC